MTILAQAADGGTWIYLALGIAIGLFALAAWGTHWVWYFRSFGMGMGNVVLSGRYALGVIGLVVPIVGIIHGGRDLGWRWCTGRQLTAASKTPAAGQDRWGRIA